MWLGCGAYGDVSALLLIGSGFQSNTSDPAGPARRFPAKRPPKVRSTLTDPAVYYEVHFDGHEKLNFKALCMGHASIDTYGARCHGSGYVLQMTIVPNARCAVTVGHLFLDLAESTGNIPVQITVDGGTETQYMFALQEQVRYVLFCIISQWKSEFCGCAQFMPDLPAFEVPACVKSSDNIPIESLWSYLLKFTGHDLKAAILLGKTNNYMNPANELHIDLFHWLWPNIVQYAIDGFVTYWNMHKTRCQSAKSLPSGVSPKQVYEDPRSYGLRHAGIPLYLHKHCG
ncbi:hypothetical protein GGX14DRAFT_363137 [Mycena pura]|uniref:Uncharacterized protein n=1 Tax=Mycena pura TaxID=153505 RepID=A0AAD6VIB7_9AGAR|nr:hypothetical protein GGX14DRAFT_363137 [Mycena pura]